MGKGTSPAIVAIALIALLSFLALQPMAGASENTATCDLDSIVLDDQYRIVLVLAEWSKPMQLDNIGIVLVAPVPGSPETSGSAHYLRLLDSMNMSFGDKLLVTYEPMSADHASEGDRVVIESLGTSGLPQGQWQLYLVQVSTSYSILGVLWTLGNEPVQDYQLPYARSSIEDPLVHFGFISQGTSWTFVAIFISEAALLAVIVLLISRTK